MMKNLILLFALLLGLYSCSPDKTKTNENTKSNMEVGVQNANGNMPDTTNAINLSTQKKDSTKIDSTRK
ncbi:MAG: hypothetical protein NVSMB45_05110 [Ginsengibacter sp.]